MPGGDACVAGVEVAGPGIVPMPLEDDEDEARQTPRWLSVAWIGQPMAGVGVRSELLQIVDALSLSVAPVCLAIRLATD